MYLIAWKSRINSKFYRFGTISIQIPIWNMKVLGQKLQSQPKMKVTSSNAPTQYWRPNQPSVLPRIYPPHTSKSNFSLNSLGWIICIASAWYVWMTSKHPPGCNIQLGELRKHGSSAWHLNNCFTRTERTWKDSIDSGNANILQLCCSSAAPCACMNFVKLF